MHGIIHAELKKYIETRHSPDTWKACLEAAGLRGKVYLAISAYPDEEAVAIVTAAAKLTCLPVEQLLEELGEFMVPDLFSLYHSLIKPEWKTIQMLLHTEAVIHRVVRLQNPGAEPPKLHFEQVGPKELKFYYNSPRRMAAVARGIMKGIAKHYGESVSIREQKKADGSSEMSIIVT
jgi:hypothetical protein